MLFLKQGEADNGAIQLLYNSLFDSLGCYYKSKSPELTFEQFKSFFPVFAVNTVPSGSI